jgi:O-antigen/teichoic acid export membrane protein
MINVYPVLSRSYAESDRREGAQRIQDQALKYLLAVSIPLGVALFVAARPLIELTVGSGFGASVTPLRVLSASVVFLCIQAVLWRVLAARGEQAAVLRVQVATAATRIGSGFPLIVGFGAIGAAVTSTLNTVLQAVLLARQVRRDGTTVRLARFSWRFAVAAAAMGAISWVCLAHAGGFWLAVPVGLVSYAVFVVVLRGFSSSDYQLIRRAVAIRPAATTSTTRAMST